MRLWIARAIPFAAVIALFSAIACTHSGPFDAGDHTLEAPFLSGEPSRLTWADGNDADPVWLPEGESFIYSFVQAESQPQGTADDRCLGIMHARGGQIIRLICAPQAGQDDTISVFAQPSPSTDGRLAFLRSVAPVRAARSLATGLVVAPLAEPWSLTPLRSLPFTGPDGAFYVEIGTPVWLGADALAFIGVVQELVTPCPGCDAVEVRRSNGVLRLELADGHAMSAVPGTQAVTSIAAGSEPDALYLTRAADARIFRRVLSTGAETVVHTFPEGIPTSLGVTNGRAVAVVRGELHVVDLTTGVTRSAGGAPHILDRPSLHPDGELIVASGIQTGDPTNMGSSIWRISLP